MSRRVLASLAAGGLLLAGASVLNPATAADEALPHGYPTPGCNTFEDIKGDGTPILLGPAKLDNDPDLDATGIAIGTSAAELTAAIRLDALKALPAKGNGHQFQVTFTHNAKTITLYTLQADSTMTQVRSVQEAAGSASGFVPATGGMVGTAVEPKLTVSSTYDTARSLVILKVDRESLETVTGKPIEGATLTNVTGTTYMLLANGNKLTADTVQATVATYAVGDNKCFPPPPSKLENFSDDTVQYGDQAEVVTQLTNDLDEALEGKTVTFSVGAKKVTAVTDEEGVATAMFDPGALAGHVNLITTFAGDDEAAAVTLSSPLIVTQEKTKTTATAGRSGTKRTVTAKVLDDDNHPVAGQTVTFLVGTKKLGTAKTSSAGIAVFSGGTAGQTIVASFTAVSGKYLASKAPGVKV
jgi:FKBP-type peptidyl-prolyl cis-trans isomerase 2